MSQAHSFLGLLADPTRLRVVAAVALGASGLDDVVQATGIDQVDAVRAVERLVGAGVLERADGDGGSLRVAIEHLADAARPPVDAAASAVPPFWGATAQQAALIGEFVEDGRLRQIPAGRAKRLAVLDVLATHFEPGRVYSEQQVDLVLARFSDDHVTLRRYLVDEEFFERSGGRYWRAGGTFEID
jgi:hypothetical protein